MDRIVVLGEQLAVDGFALAGATIARADDPDAVRSAWAALPADVAILVLSASAARVLGTIPELERSALLTIAMPQ